MRFSDFVTLQRGFDLPKAQMRDGPYPVLGSTSIIGHHDEFKVEPPGVITGRSGSLGVVQYVDQRFWPHNTALWVKDFKGNDPRFVYYAMKALDFARFNAGAGVPTLNRNHLDTLEVEVPSLDVQKRIAEVLSAYDDLIENSQRRIQILESMARAIYREWFVNFRFPGHESVTRITSPVGDIPQGWRVERLCDLFDFIGGSQPPKSEHIHEKRPGYVRFIQNRDYNSSSHLTYIADSRRNKICGRLDVMVDKYGEPGKTRYGLAGAYNVALAKLEPHKTHHREWLRGFISEPEFGAYLAAASMAATRASLNSSHFVVDVSVPSEALSREFQNLVEPILQLVLAHKDAIQNLRRTRDLLLPRLLSGQIDVEAIAA